MLARLRLQIEASLNRTLKQVSPVRGGDIHQAYQLVTEDNERFFLKTNTADGAQAMFETEARGLQLLSQCDALVVPDVVASGTSSAPYLILSWLDEAQDQSYRLGRGLAKLHGITSDAFGLDHDNFIATIDQLNAPDVSWPDFYADRRIEPLLQLCKSYLDAGDLRLWDRMRQKLAGILSQDQPVMLHGDLWSGNAMNTTQGPAIFDPAVYYGDPIVDIAMTQLFGGFSNSFYAAYFEIRPRPEATNLAERIEIYQLYYLLVHLALFGTGYLGSVRRILKRYGT